MEGHCSTGQSPQWALVPMEEEEEVIATRCTNLSNLFYFEITLHIFYFFLFIFTVVPCISISIKFIHQQMHFVLNLTKF